MIRNELSGCASPGLSLLPAHPLSLAFSLPPAHLPKDPGSQPLIQFHPRAHIVTATVSLFWAALCQLISNLTSFPPPASFEITVLLSYFTNEETKTEENKSTTQVHSVGGEQS